MAYSCRKQTALSRNTAVICVCFFTLSLFNSCGLPSPGDVAEPPFNINDEGSRVSFNIRNSHALAIYYCFITSGSTVEQNFGNITTNGESALSSRGYRRSNDLEVYVWVSTSGTTGDLVNVTLEYARLNSQAKLTVTSNGTILFENKTLLRNSTLTGPNVGFASPMTAYKDTGTVSSGPVDVALAAITYKLNPTTLQLTPSVPQFLGYMRGLQIN